MGTVSLSRLLSGSIKGLTEATPTSTAQGVVGTGCGRNCHRRWLSEQCVSQSFWDRAPSLMSDLGILEKRKMELRTSQLLFRFLGFVCMCSYLNVVSLAHLFLPLSRKECLCVDVREKHAERKGRRQLRTLSPTNTLPAVTNMTSRLPGSKS